MNEIENTTEDGALVVEDTEVKKPHLNQATAEKFARSVRQKLCKNATVEVYPTGEVEMVMGLTTKIAEESFDVRGDGCRNQRRNGSAFCQECSDKYKK